MRRFLLCLLLALTAVSACTSRREVRSVDDLSDARIGVLTNLAQHRELPELFPRATLLRFEELPSMCLALRGRKIDAMICLEPGLDNLLVRNPDFRELGELPVRDSSAVAFRPGGDRLAALFNDFFDEMRGDGSLEAMQANWFGPDAPHSFYHAHAKDGEPLRVGIEVGQSGLTVMEDGEETGFEPELMRRFGDWLGRPVHFVEMTSTGMIPALVSGRVDALVDAITPTHDRSSSVLFSEPYYICNLHLVTLNPEAHGRRQSGNALRQNLFEDGRGRLILKGLWITLIIVLFSILLGSVLGVLLCQMHLSGKPALEKFSHGWCEFIEGVPVVVLLLFMFYVVFASSTLGAVIVAIITYSLHFSAGACESILSGIRSVPRGQDEAGQALGLTRWQTQRYVTIPQALRHILLLFKGKSVALIENTAIVGFIAIQDLTKVTDIIRSQTYNSLIPLVVVGVLYFLLAKLICLGIDKLGDALLKK